DTGGGWGWGGGYFGGSGDGFSGVSVGGSPNDCGGPCVPFQFSALGGCTGYVTYSVEAITMDDGSTELHSMPSISYGCGGRGGPGLSLSQITASIPTSSSSGGGAGG